MTEEEFDKLVHLNASLPRKTLKKYKAEILIGKINRDSTIKLFVNSEINTAEIIRSVTNESL